jgi:phosphoglycerol transferase
MIQKQKDTPKLKLLNFFPGAVFKKIIIGLLSLLVLSQIYFLWSRTLNLNGFVFSDEYTYQKMTNENVDSGFEIPNYLYILQTRLTTQFSLDIQYQLIRIQNLFAFLIGNFCIWRIALRYLGKTLSFAVFTATHFFSINTYTAFFMPEAQYYGAFWMLLLFLIRFLEGPSNSRAVIVGLSWAYLSLIKPHATFLLIGFAIFYIYCLGREKTNRLALSITWGTILIVGIFTKLLIGFILDGQNGLTLFGDYDSVISENLPAPSLFELLKLFLQSFAGQVFGILIVFSTPIALFVMAILEREKGVERETPNFLFLILVFICLAVLMLVVAAYSTRILFIDPGQSITRIHERYYSFVYPIFLIQLGHTWKNRNLYIAEAKFQNFSLSLMFALTLFFGFEYFQDNFVVNFIDSPNILSVIGDNHISVVYVALSILILRFLALKKIVVLLCVFIQIPLYSYQGNILVNRNLQFWGANTIYEEGAIFAKSIVPSIELNSLEVVGKSQGNVVRVPFRLANAKIKVSYPDADNKFNLSPPSSTSTWVLVFDDIDVYGDYLRVIKKEDFSLYELE